MTDEKNVMAQLSAACWKDEALKARFMAEPKAVLAEHDMSVPDGIDLMVVQDSDDCARINPPLPPLGRGGSGMGRRWKKGRRSRSAWIHPERGRSRNNI